MLVSAIQVGTVFPVEKGDGFLNQHTPERPRPRPLARKAKSSYRRQPFSLVDIIA